MGLAEEQAAGRRALKLRVIHERLDAVEAELRQLLPRGTNLQAKVERAIDEKGYPIEVGLIAIVMVEVANKKHMEFREPYDAFPSDHMIAQLLLVT